MGNPLVSVLVPVYQAEVYIERCARSLFEQTYDNLEYLFCDDCSADASIRKLESVMKDYPARLEQIRIIHHERNRGSAVARNTLIDNCKGVFCFWADADDWVEINAVELLVKKQQETDADVVITEIGGTIGDIESQPFIEAVRQISLEVGKTNSLFIHVTLVPFLKGSDEHKTKPTQHSVKELQGMGVSPNIVVLRCDEPLEESIFKKISMFCNVKEDCVIENITLDSLYEAPIMLEDAGLANVVCRELELNCARPNLGEWKDLVDRIENRTKDVTIGLVGKYVQLHDAYLSVVEALNHAGFANNAHVNIEWIDSEELNEDNYKEKLSKVSGIIVPGGFGDRGIEGMILSARYAREEKIPYLGICLGMQIAVIEYARDVAGITDACSGEFHDPSDNRVIDFMPGQSDDINKGGTLRLGSYPCVIKESTMMKECYGEELIHERHRHRYEFNNDFREVLTENGLVISGLSPDGELVETVEVKDHPFFVGVQFHPEFKSRPNRPHPLFNKFVESSLK